MAAIRRIGAALLVATSLGCVEARPAAPDPPCVPSETVVCSSVHPEGLLDPASEDFHGAEIRRLGYDLSSCGSCHGPRLNGGSSGASCLGCHDEGVLACKTCHADLESSGAHRPHLRGGVLGLAMTCDVCHLAPASAKDQGHFLLRDGFDPPPVEVRLSATGSSAPGIWDARARTCQVGCHGAKLSAAVRAPSWDQAIATGCDRCHGAPPPSHERSDCQTCHGRVGDGTAISNAALHLDGRIDLGDGSDTCDACHRVDDAGHRIHARAPHRIRGPIACGDCHQVPESVSAPGHLDLGPVDVFPPGFGGLAEAGGRSPTYAAGRCSDVYCHGGNALEFSDSETVTCGSCHGVPPADADHRPTDALDSCAGCHPGSVDTFGNPILVDGVSLHLDGRIQR